MFIIQSSAPAAFLQTVSLNQHIVIIITIKTVITISAQFVKSTQCSVVRTDISDGSISSSVEA